VVFWVAGSNNGGLNDVVWSGKVWLASCVRDNRTTGSLKALGLGIYLEGCRFSDCANAL
jgi:hypothetical protein